MFCYHHLRPIPIHLLLPINIKLIISALIQTLSCEQGGVLRQVVVDGAAVRQAGQPRQREVDDGSLYAAGLNFVLHAVDNIVHTLSRCLLKYDTK